MCNKLLLKLLALYLVFAIIILALPVQGWAMFIPIDQNTPARQADLKIIQKTLESNLIRQRLMDYGITAEESLARVNRLSDEQIHQIATNLDSLQAGADGVDTLIFLLVMAIVVVIVLELTGHRVIIKK